MAGQTSPTFPFITIALGFEKCTLGWGEDTLAFIERGRKLFSYLSQHGIWRDTWCLLHLHYVSSLEVLINVPRKLLQPELLFC